MLKAQSHMRSRVLTFFRNVIQEVGESGVANSCAYMLTMMFPNGEKIMQMAVIQTIVGLFMILSIAFWIVYSGFS